VLLPLLVPVPPMATNIISGLMVIYTRRLSAKGDVVENPIEGWESSERSLLVTRLQTPRNELGQHPELAHVTALRS